MKGNEIPELSSAWWKKHKAKTLSDDSLTKALIMLEGQKKKATKSGQPIYKAVAELEAYRKLLKAFDKIVTGTIKKANSVLHKETIQVLKRYDKVVKTEEADVDRWIGEQREKAQKKFDDDCTVSEKACSDYLQKLKNQENKLTVTTKKLLQATDSKEKMKELKNLSDKIRMEMLSTSVLEDKVRGFKERTLFDFGDEGYPKNFAKFRDSFKKFILEVDDVRQFWQEADQKLVTKFNLLEKKFE